VPEGTLRASFSKSIRPERKADAGPSALRVMPSGLKIWAARKSASGAWRDRSALFSLSWSGRPGRASAKGRFMAAF
jgi:hypothetical protein